MAAASLATAMVGASASGDDGGGGRAVCWRRSPGVVRRFERGAHEAGAFPRNRFLSAVSGRTGAGLMVRLSSRTFPLIRAWTSLNLSQSSPGSLVGEVGAWRVPVICATGGCGGPRTMRGRVGLRMMGGGFRDILHGQAQFGGGTLPKCGQSAGSPGDGPFGRTDFLFEGRHFATN